MPRTYVDMNEYEHDCQRHAEEGDDGEQLRESEVVSDADESSASAAIPVMERCI